MKKLMLVLAFLAPQIYAANWVKVAGNWEFNKNSTVIEVNTDSVQLKDGYRQAWVRTSTSEPQPLPDGQSKNYQSNSSLEHYDCKNKTVSASQIAYYQAPFSEGELILSSSRSESEAKAAMEQPASGTFGETLLNKVCGFKLK